MPSAQS